MQNCDWFNSTENCELGHDCRQGAFTLPTRHNSTSMSANLLRFVKTAANYQLLSTHRRHDRLVDGVNWALMSGENNLCVTFEWHDRLVGGVNWALMSGENNLCVTFEWHERLVGSVNWALISGENNVCVTFEWEQVLVFHYRTWAVQRGMMTDQTPAQHTIHRFIHSHGKYPTHD